LFCIVEWHVAQQCTNPLLSSHFNSGFRERGGRRGGAVGLGTAPQIAGSIPHGVSGFFHWHNPVGPTVALGSTQPLTEMNTRNISWGVKAAGAYG
jgi:hypothetical protein